MGWTSIPEKISFRRYIYIVRAIFRILIVHFCSNSSPKLTEITGSHNFMNHLISMLEPRRRIFSFMVGIYLYGGPLQYSWHIGCFFKKLCPLRKKTTINFHTRRRNVAGIRMKFVCQYERTHLKLHLRMLEPLQGPNDGGKGY